MTSARKMPLDSAIQENSLRRNLIAAGVFVLILAVFYSRSLFGGMAMLPTDQIFDFAFFRTGTPSNFERPANFLMSDMTLKFYPWAMVTREAFKDGEFPFWNPYTYSGTPHFANGESTVLYPIHLLSNLLPLNASFAFSAALRMFVAGFGMYLFLRLLRISFVGSLIGGIAFMLGGSMLMWLSYPLGAGYTWMPIVFWAGERILSRRRLSGAVLLGVVVGNNLLAGHLQISFIQFLLLGLYSLFRLYMMYVSRSNMRGAAQAAGLLVLGMFLGVMLAAVLVLPFWNWLNLTGESERRMQLVAASGEGLNLDFLMNIVVGAIVLVLPNAFGNPALNNMDVYLGVNYIEQTIYIGVIPLAFGIIAVIVSLRRSSEELTAEQRRQIYFFLTAGLVMLALAFGVPLIDFIKRLPVFNVVSASRYRMAFTFCLIVLAAFGFDYFIQQLRNTTIVRRLMIGLVAAAMVSVVGLVAAFIGMTAFRDRLMSINRLAVNYETIQGLYRPINLDVYFPVVIVLLFVGLLILYRRQSIQMNGLLTGSVIIVALDLFVFGFNFNPVIPDSWVYPEVPASQFMQQSLADLGPVRVLDLYDVMPANSGTPYGIQVPTGSDFPSKRYSQIALAVGMEFASSYRIRSTVVTDRILDLFNIQYVMHYQPLEDDLNGRLQLAYEDGSLYVYENQSLLPRAFVVHQAETVTDDVELLERLTAPNFDLSRQVLLEVPAPADLPSGDVTTVSENVKITDYATQHVTIQAQLDQPGFLVLLDAAYPGWSVTVNGQESTLYRANYDFRAVYLPAGEHTVEFRFRMPGFEAGAAITAAGLILSVLLAGTDTFLRRRALRNAA